ncbi:hypothetical protein C0Q70_08044 [Pomacea canaliculata]|uniref:CARD domain-containing protein n=1 Tax=Pomacea canaliculata TaxID=400727 RepID=A0A2T7PGQ5_POMCA|nr:hypothetical protein C0Q70_08044 [Pomacea canaliculata]
MIEALYKIIQTGYADLVQEIDPQPGVIDILFSKNVLNHEEKIKLQKTSGDEEKVRFILDKLKYKPDQAYSIFREAVLKDQPHLENLLPLLKPQKKMAPKDLKKLQKVLIMNIFQNTQTQVQDNKDLVRDCGLLGMLEESIKKKRSLSLKTWCHAPTSFGEKSTQWWCLRGRRDEPDSIKAIEHKMPPAQVNSLVKDLEIIICNKDMPKRRLEVTYLNWLSEIRNPNCKVYNLETVLEHVRNWRSTINSPKSTLYLFIIQSLIGFGSKTQPGNTECLTEALELLRGEILKKRNLMFRPKYPREWLGRLDIEGIRRLVPSKAVEYDTHRKIKDISRAKLATCKGTIRQKNDNKLAGYVDLDLHGNGSLVEVFYIPVRAGLEGSRYAGYRVQFHLAFTMEHGYEAFEVELLKKYQCHKCPLKVEIMRDEDEAKCRCGAWIAKSVYTEASDDS